MLLKVKASQYSVEAANPQHEHEWKLWKEVKLPEGKALIPGVVTHKTNILATVDKILVLAHGLKGISHDQPNLNMAVRLMGVGKVLATLRPGNNG